MLRRRPQHDNRSGLPFHRRVALRRSLVVGRWSLVGGWWVGGHEGAPDALVVEISVEASPEAVDWVTMAVASSGFGLRAVARRAAWRARRRCGLGIHDPSVCRPRRIGRCGGGKGGSGRSLLRACPVWSAMCTSSRSRRPRPHIRRPQRIGEHFVLLNLTRWRHRDRRPVLRLAPNQAFGTGLHPTTRLVLRLLERHVRAGNTRSTWFRFRHPQRRAGMMGARVLALDNDPHAVDATRKRWRSMGWMRR